MNKQEHTNKKNQSMLDSLLCIIHRDGGHYIEEHGYQKAFADAIHKINNYHIIEDEYNKTAITTSKS